MAAKKQISPNNIEDNEDYTIQSYSKSKGFKNTIDIIECFIYAVVAVLLIFTFFARLTIVSGASMDTTLRNGEYLIVSNVFFTYKPENGDIVVIQGDFEHYYGEIYGEKHVLAHNYSEPIVKRVIATEGQTVKIDYNTKKIYINGIEQDDSFSQYVGEEHPEYYTLGEYVTNDYGTEYYNPYYNNVTRIFEATVPSGCVFVLGDNRNASADSRLKEIGFVPKEFIVGKAVFRLTPFSRMGGL